MPLGELKNRIGLEVKGKRQLLVHADEIQNFLPGTILKIKKLE